MKILFVNSFAHPIIGGGAEYTLQTISEGLASKGHEVVVVSTAQMYGVDYTGNGSVKNYRLPIFNIYWHFRKNLPNRILRIIWHVIDVCNLVMKARLQKIVEKEQPDVICYHNLAGLSRAAWTVSLKNKKRIPKVQVIHDFYLACPSASMFKNNSGACKQRCIECRTFRYLGNSGKNDIDAIVGVSHFVANRFVDLGVFEKSKVVVIHNASDIPDVQKPRSALIDSIPTFGFLGSLIPTKGVKWLIDQFIKNFQHARLLIAGSGSQTYVDDLKTLSKNHDIQFLGYVSQSEFLKKIDILVVPSIWPEVLGRVAYEASACHVPVIASNVGGLPEMVTAGVNGELCDPSIPDTLGDAMLKISKNLEYYAALSKNSRSAVGEFIDAANMVGSYERLFFDVVSSN